MIDMIGFRSGRLVVMAPAQAKKPKRAYWQCRCDCGNTYTVMGKYLRRGDVKSCGCLNRQGVNGPPNLRHGHAVGGQSPTYRVWAGMIQRCHDPKSSGYYKYGARGITVCARWRHSFDEFLADMGVRPTGKSIERNDNDGNYEPGNCRWATGLEQAQNKRTSRRITFNGETLILSEWARRIGINSGSLHTRLRKWSVEKALTTPKRQELS